MNRKFFIGFVLLLAGFSASAQMSADYYKSQYQRQVKVLGVAGVGVETILDKWAEVAPDDPDMLEGRFSYYLEKASNPQVVTKETPKYLGQKPMLELKDSLGVAHYYYQVQTYTDSLFALSASAIEKAIAARPDELKYRIQKIAALLAYEGESPDMAEAEVLKLVDMHVASHPAWTYLGEPADDDTFQTVIQEYCFSFYSLGTPRSYDAFYNISERMSKVYPKEAVYVSNIGSYWLVAKDNKKKAQQYYKKALKIDPEDYAATRNMKLIQSSSSQKGRSSK